MRASQLIISFALMSMIACNNQSTARPETQKTETPETIKEVVFDKLMGLWQGTGGTNFEQWTKNEDGTYRSVGFSIKGTDTSWNEQANIYPENDKWVFENTVKGQNNGKAVKFISSSISANSVQFSNPAHDFPTDINYTISDVNTIHAFITGPGSTGGKDTIPFNFTRLK